MRFTIVLSCYFYQKLFTLLFLAASSGKQSSFVETTIALITEKAEDHNDMKEWLYIVKRCFQMIQQSRFA